MTTTHLCMGADRTVPVAYRRPSPLGGRRSASPEALCMSPPSEADSPAAPLPRRLSLIPKRPESCFSPFSISPSAVSDNSGPTAKPSATTRHSDYITVDRADRAYNVPQVWPISRTSRYQRNGGDGYVSDRTHRRHSSIRYGPRSYSPPLSAPLAALTSTAASASTTSTTAPSAGKDRPELHADFLDRHQREYPERHNASHAVSQQEYEEQQRALQATKIEARENLYRAELQRTRRSVLSTTVGRRRPLSLVATRAIEPRDVIPHDAVPVSASSRASALASSLSMANQLPPSKPNAGPRRTRSLVDMSSLRPASPPTENAPVGTLRLRRVRSQTTFSRYNGNLCSMGPVSSTSAADNSLADSFETQLTSVLTPEQHSFEDSFADSGSIIGGSIIASRRWSAAHSVASVPSMSIEDFEGEVSVADLSARAAAMSRLNGISTVDSYEVEIGWLETIQRLQEGQQSRKGANDLDFATCATQLFPPSEPATSRPVSRITSIATSVGSPLMCMAEDSPNRADSARSSFSTNSAPMYRRRAAVKTFGNYPRTVPTHTHASSASTSTSGTGHSYGLGFGFVLPPSTEIPSTVPEEGFVATSAWHSGATDGALPAAKSTGFPFGEEESLGGVRVPPRRTRTLGSKHLSVVGKRLRHGLLSTHLRSKNFAEQQTQTVSASESAPVAGAATVSGGRVTPLPHLSRPSMTETPSMPSGRPPNRSQSRQSNHRATRAFSRFWGTSSARFTKTFGRATGAAAAAAGATATATGSTFATATAAAMPSTEPTILEDASPSSSPSEVPLAYRAGPGVQIVKTLDDVFPPAAPLCSSTSTDNTTATTHTTQPAVLERAASPTTPRRPAIPKAFMLGTLDDLVESPPRSNVDTVASAATVVPMTSIASPVKAPPPPSAFKRPPIPFDFTSGPSVEQLVDSPMREASPPAEEPQSPTPSQSQTQKLAPPTVSSTGTTPRLRKVKHVSSLSDAFAAAGSTPVTMPPRSASATPTRGVGLGLGLGVIGVDTRAATPTPASSASASALASAATWSPANLLRPMSPAGINASNANRPTSPTFLRPTSPASFTSFLRPTSPAPQDRCPSPVVPVSSLAEAFATAKMPHPSSKKKGRALTWVKRATEKARAANPFRHALHVQAVHA